MDFFTTLFYVVALPLAAATVLWRARRRAEPNRRHTPPPARLALLPMRKDLP